jgi:hypothetical protein
MNAPYQLLLLSFASTIAVAGEILLPPSLERDQVAVAVYRTNGQATGKGELAIRWTDRLGRAIEDRTIPVELTDENEIRFPLDLRRAVAMGNELTVHFKLAGINKKGAPDRREEDASVSFIARPPDGSWRDYMVMMWQPHSAERFATLKTLGINGGQYSGRAKTPPEFLLANDLRWYAENLATDFYSEYHRYRPDRIQHWSFLQAKELYRKDLTSKEAFKRHPSLSDPAWLKQIHDRLVDAARLWSPYRPIFYDLGDESGIADLAGFWDFDFSDFSLAAMRVWLRDRYGTLSALNQQWGSSFASWELVTPLTTREAMQAPGENFSSWADHKEWMDIAYARAVKMGVDAIRSVDPDAYAGIAGAQMPGWGGYDYYRLSQAVTAIEPYDIGNNIEILRSLNPEIAIVTTAFARGPWEKHRIWYELLHGARGNIIWDEASEHIAPDGSTGARGREAASYYQEIRKGIGALLINSRRESGPIAIHYSQASMRTEWMLAERPKGDAWIDRMSSNERKDSDFLRVRESYCRLIEDLGLQYDFIAYGQIENGELAKHGDRVLILPRSSALSEAETRAMEAFVAQGGLLIADGQPGQFDEHGRRWQSPRLGDLFAEKAERGKAVRFDAIDYHQQRLMHKEGPTRQAFEALLRGAGVKPEFAVVDEAGRPATGVETHTFRNGSVTIVGLLTNPQLRVDELGPPEFRSNERFEKPQSINLVLPRELNVYDIRQAESLGRKTRLQVTLDPYEPALYAFSPAPVPELQVAAPGKLARGTTGHASVRFASAAPAVVHVLHVDLQDPSGRVLPHYGGNLLAPNGLAQINLPLAQNDPAGRWTLRVRDILSGQAQTAAIEVY